MRRLRFNKGISLFFNIQGRSSRAVVYLLRGDGIIIFPAQGRQRDFLSCTRSLARGGAAHAKLIFQKQFGALHGENAPSSVVFVRPNYTCHLACERCLAIWCALIDPLCIIRLRFSARVQTQWTQLAGAGTGKIAYCANIIRRSAFYGYTRMLAWKGFISTAHPLSKWLNAGEHANLPPALLRSFFYFCLSTGAYGNCNNRILVICVCNLLDTGVVLFAY